MATKTVNIALDEKLVEQIDEQVKKDMGSRSEYFRRLALNDLERQREWKAVFDEGNALGRKLGLTEEEVNRRLAEYKREATQS
jgi:metal-responsive CopG/Arc/MetJ family transcriptional regulator